MATSFLVPIIAAIIIYGLSRITQSLLYVYLLFFSISITSALGFTETLTGLHATSTSMIFYGLAFYTAYFAYHIQKSHQRMTLENIFIGANPLLLITGPIGTFFNSIHHRSFKKRIKYFLPYIVIGIFMFKIVATPLTEYFFMLELTNLQSALLFALIFELFVYANFCGLSLMIYGVFGIAGVRIPLNFRQPFSARSLIDFWKGWHVSLSMVLKELFYKPVKRQLKASRFGTQASIIVVFLASAVWHGVTVNLLIWGLFHGALFVFTLFLVKKEYFFLTPFILVIGVVVGRMIFAESDTERLFEKLSFSLDTTTTVFTQLTSVPKATLASLVIGLTLIFIEFLFLKNRHVAKRNYKYLRVPFAQMVLIGLFVLLVSSNIGVDYAAYGQR